MNQMRVTKIELGEYNNVRFSPDGRLVVIVKSQTLLVIDLEQQYTGPMVRQFFLDVDFQMQSLAKIVFFQDYIVLVNIQRIEGLEPRLQLIRYDFRLASTLRLRLEFCNLNWGHLPKVNLYEALPSNVCEYFLADYVYFHDAFLRPFFKTDQIVLEIKGTDYQIIAIHNKSRLLASYEPSLLLTDPPSPFSMPYFYEPIVQNKFRIRRYKEGRLSKGQLLFLPRSQSFKFFSHSIFLLSADSYILMKSRQKTLRTFRSDGLQFKEIQQHYIIAITLCSNSEIIGKIDVRNGKFQMISNRSDVILRGKFIFWIRRYEQPSTPTFPIYPEFTSGSERDLGDELIITRIQ